MATNRFMGVATSAVLSLLRLLWRLRLLVVVILLVLLAQYMYCQRDTPSPQLIPPHKCPNCAPSCVPYPSCLGSAYQDAGLGSDL